MSFYPDGMTAQEWEAEYKEIQDEWREEEMKQVRKDVRCLRKQKRKLSKYRLSDLEELFYTYENSCNYTIVQTRGGTKQKESEMRYHFFQGG